MLVSQSVLNLCRPLYQVKALPVSIYGTLKHGNLSHIASYSCNVDFLIHILVIIWILEVVTFNSSIFVLAG